MPGRAWLSPRRPPPRAVRFGPRHLASERGEAVDSLAVASRAIRDGAVGEQAIDDAVKGAGAEADGAIGLRFHGLQQGVTVALLVGERDEDVEDGG